MRNYSVVVLGGGGVGKSAIVTRFIDGSWSEIYNPTVEDSYQKIVDDASGKLNLEIIDTAGYEQFSAIKPTLLEGGDGFVIIFSYDNWDSFKLAAAIVVNLRLLRGNSVPIVVVANKMDIVQHRSVVSQHTRQFTRDYKSFVYDTTAYLNKGITPVFQDIINAMVAENPEGSPRLKKKKSAWWKKVF